ncbi:uncharacterized protein TNCV_3857341 [Trichonephila clavipes]|nr:uncharacterized protein TNCV_3857341 [Trichonephila clavipes]
MNFVSDMFKAIWAIYFHKLSTDSVPQHGLCPTSPDTWCGFNKAKLLGEAYSHKHSLPELVLLVIKPTFKSLSDKKPLEKCTHGKTQNPIESFDHCMWERLPKTTFLSIESMKIGVMDAVITFNDGAQSRIRVLEEIGIKPDHYMRKSPNLKMRSEISRQMWDKILKWEIVNSDHPDQDNGTKLLNYCIVVGPG